MSSSIFSLMSLIIVRCYICIVLYICTNNVNTIYLIDYYKLYINYSIKLFVICAPARTRLGAGRLFMCSFKLCL